MSNLHLYRHFMYNRSLEMIQNIKRVIIENMFNIIQYQVFNELISDL